jgi:RNA polymerase sigma-70 factor, ECF subfamily
LEFHPFDADYVESLSAGDPCVEEHFVHYFTSLLNLKLRARLHSPPAIEDVRQETFTRVLAVLRRDKTLRNPERLGAFVNTVCNNVLLEHYRASTRHDLLDESQEAALVADGPGVFDEVLSSELKAQVSRILKRISPRDRALLQAVFIEERDREEVCREFGVGADYLRVLLFRAKQSFKLAFLKEIRHSLSMIDR